MTEELFMERMGREDGEYVSGTIDVSDVEEIYVEGNQQYVKNTGE